MKLHVVLVRTEYSSNIGAAARASANMGADRLILIDPRCELDSKAKQMAAGAQDMLGGTVVYPHWQAFYATEGDGVRIALTRRTGGNRKVIPLESCAFELKAELPQNLYLVFGPEADGLNNEDLAFINFTCHLPAYGEFSSYNLSQAVLIALLLVRQQLPPDVLPRQTREAGVAAVKPFYFPDELIKEWLTAMGFDIRARRSSAYITLRRLFLSKLPTRHEIQVLEAILQQNIRKLRGEKDLVGFAAEKLADNLGNVARKDI